MCSILISDYSYYSFNTGNVLSVDLWSPTVHKRNSRVLIKGQIHYIISGRNQYEFIVLGHNLNHYRFLDLGDREVPAYFLFLRDSSSQTSVSMVPIKGYKNNDSK